MPKWKAKRIPNVLNLEVGELVQHYKTGRVARILNENVYEGWLFYLFVSLFVKLRHTNERIRLDP